MKIPFNRPYLTGKELDYIKKAHASGHLSGDGEFSRKCHRWLEKYLDCQKAFLTHSGTAALEMAAILANIKAGDEIIMPSFTFVSTANAFVLRGAVPVFVDIRPDTLNIDEKKIEAAITKKTKAIVPVHYAGVGCEMDAIMRIAKKHNLLVIEDACHGLMARYKKRPLGSIGHMAALSFHETKNIISGEGGAILVNDARFSGRAEIIREKGTNRSSFFRGETDKYTWVDIGSSYLPSELEAAFLWAQMEKVRDITKKRLCIWNEYHAAFAGLEKIDKVRRPVIPEECVHNAHMYYLLLPNPKKRNLLISHLRKKGILAIFHYVPLDSSCAGRKYAKKNGRLDVTGRMSECVVRLPLWTGMPKKDLMHIIDRVLSFFV